METLSIVDCPLCHRPPSDHIEVSRRDRNGRPLRSVLCHRCGLVFSNPMPSAAALEAFYVSQYRQLYQKANTPKPWHILRSFKLARRRLEGLRGHLPSSGRVLDLGAGGGEWVCTLSRAGFGSVGIEPSEGFGEYARREYGADIAVAPLDAASVSGRFDAVTAFHVLEHIPDPMGALQKLRSLLRHNEDARLIIEVPNIEATDQSKASKFHFAHVIGFTPDSLLAMAARAGYRMIADLTGQLNGQNVAMVFAADKLDPTAIPSPASIDRTLASLRRWSPVHRRSLQNAAIKVTRTISERIVTRGKSGAEIAASVLSRMTMR